MTLTKRPASRGAGLLITILCVALCFILASFFVTFSIQRFSSPDNLSFLQLSVINNVSSIITFGLAALLAARFAFGWIRIIWGFSSFSLSFFLLSIICIFACQPFVEWGCYINEMLCEHFNYDYQAHNAQNYQLIARMIDFSTPLSTTITICTIALIPAICEEMLFRGVLQQSFCRIWRNHRTAIFITAILFSLCHGEISGFIPRLILGIILGIIFYHTRNLFFCILAHFTNNAMTILALNSADKPIDELLRQPTENPGALWPIISFMFIMYIFSTSSYAKLLGKWKKILTAELKKMEENEKNNDNENNNQTNNNKL